MKKIKLFRLLALFIVLIASINNVWAAATNFTEGELLFVQADGDGAWKDNACVKLWFHNTDGSTIGPTWIRDWSGGGGSGKMFYVIVPSGTYSQVRVQRWASNCTTWWNESGDINHSARSGNVITAGNNSIAWRGVTYTLDLKSSSDSWASTIGTLVQTSGTATFTYTISNHVATATSYEYSVYDSYGGRLIGDNVTLSGMTVGATYDIQASYDLSTKTLTMTKTQKTFSVTASSADDDMGSVSPSSAWVGSSGVTFTASPETGYHWTSWDATGGASPSNAATSSVTATASGTITANFAPNVYSITLDKGDGDKDGSATVTYLEDSWTSHTAPTKAGWTVAGYYTDDEPAVLVMDANGNLQSSTDYTDGSGNWTYTSGSVTLYTHWKQTYSVTYYTTGSTSGAAPTDANEYAANAEVTVLGKNTLAKTYYDFIGWNTSSGQSTALYEEGDKFNITGNTALYPVWAKHEYTVTISGGTETSTTTVYDEYNGTATVSIPLNKHFTGWNLGSGVTLHEDYSTTDETIVFKANQNSTVTAQFSDIHVYIEGRFSCRSASEGAINKHVGGTEGAWDLDSKAVELTWNGSTNKYELQTYCTVAELSAQRNSNDTYIRINTCIGSTALSDDDVMGPSGSDTYMSRDGVAVTTGTNKSLIFRSSSATGAANVVITYDPATKKVAFSATETLYSVTISSGGNGSTSITGTKTNVGSVDIPITATPATAYYKFAGWTVTGGASVADASSATTTFTATANGTITAKFNNDGIVFLDKSAISSSWGGTPYVYFYSTSYWDSSDAKKGSGSKPADGVSVDGPYAMTRIGDSQIWYYDYSTTPGTGTTKNYIAFNDHYQYRYDNFVACLAIYRGDFYQKQNMFVVKDYKYYYNTGAKEGQAVYYNDGYWRKYNDTDPGYVIKTYNGYAQGSSLTGTYRLSSDEPGANNCTVDIPLNSGTNYFKVVGCDTTTINGVGYTGTYYRDASSGTMNTDNCTNWYLTDGNGSNIGVLATASADYKFTLTLGAGNLYISVDFPLAEGDFRLMYDGKMRTTYNSKKQHPSNFIRKLKQPTIADDTTRVDTISFFVDPASGDLVPSLKFQYCNDIDGYTISWRDTLDDISLSGITEAGTYNFIVTQKNYKNGSSDHEISCVLDKAYAGDYYIRTNSAKGGWKSYKVSADNLMTFSDYAKKHSGYDYYFCKWVNTDANVKFTIANDYSECITDTVDNDDIVNRDNPNNGKLQYQASVRFMYNSETNAIYRAYLNGSSDGIANYLYIKAKDGTSEEVGAKNDSIKNADGSAITSVDGYKEVKFEDNNNWVYVKNIQAREGTHVRLISDYYDNSSHHYQYLKGSNAGTWTPANTSLIIGGTSGAYQTLRMVYDFKTNQLLAAWMPSGDSINSELAIYTDVMIIREAQGDAKQIAFKEFGTPSTYGSLTDVETVYGVMQFNKYTLNNQEKTGEHNDLASPKSAYERDLYWISFPFDVNLNDVFGFGTYGTHWIIEYYDGKGRAQNGFWVDSKPNWKFVTRDMRDTFKLKAFEGYILALDLDEMNLGTNTGVWANNVTDVYLYFPSSTTLGSIVRKDTTITIDQNGYQCTINRQQPGDDYDVNKNRTIADSYWHCIGVPSFANTDYDVNDDHWTTSEGDNTSAVDAGDYPSIRSWEPGGLPFVYSWEPSDNSLIPVTTDSFTFKAMHSYMVQYNGNNINWEAVSTPVKAIAARQMDIPDLNICLQLLKDSVRQDQTFVRFTDKAGVTSGFEFNYDMSKEYNGSRGNIWTLTTNGVQVAGNSMPHPLATTIVPVGVKIATAGEYTFSMPEGTNQENVYFIDNVTGSRTNLGLMDYTVNLTTGTIDGRFSLEFGPIQDAPTGIDEMSTVNSQLSTDSVRKVFVGGRLYIIRDGKAYDATGAQVK